MKVPLWMTENQVQKTLEKPNMSKSPGPDDLYLQFHRELSSLMAHAAIYFKGHYWLEWNQVIEVEQMWYLFTKRDRYVYQQTTDQLA